MEVGNLFQLQCTLEGHGVVVAAAEEDEVAAVGEHLGELVDVLVVFQSPLHLVGNLVEFVDQHVEHFVAEGLLFLGNGQTQQAESDDLTGESLGGGYADFGTHMEVGAAMGGTGDAGADDVADAVEEGTFLLGQLDGCQGVGSFAALRNSDDHIVGIDDGITVAELRSILHFHGNLSCLLDEVLTDEGRVPAGATGADDDAAGIDELILVFDDAAEGDIVALVVQATFDAGAQGVGLLPDFLQHEVREAAFLQLVEAEAERVHLGGLVDVGEVDDVDLAAAVHVGNLLVLEVNHLLGVFHDGGGVGAQIEFFLTVGVGTHADDQRRAFAGANELVGMIFLKDGDDIGTNDALQGTLHGGEEVAFLSLLRVFDELHQHLGVGLGAELIALLLEHGTQGFVVLDDAVVHQREIAAL